MNVPVNDLWPVHLHELPKDSTVRGTKTTSSTYNYNSGGHSSSRLAVALWHFPDWQHWLCFVDWVVVIVVGVQWWWGQLNNNDRRWWWLVMVMQWRGMVKTLCIKREGRSWVERSGLPLPHSDLSLKGKYDKFDGLWEKKCMANGRKKCLFSAVVIHTSLLMLTKYVKSCFLHFFYVQTIS